jgi:hypothetical protein
LQGTAIAIGEQPIKGLLNPAAMGRLCVGEMLTNMVAAPVSSIRDIKVRLQRRPSSVLSAVPRPPVPAHSTRAHACLPACAACLRAYTCCLPSCLHAGIQACCLPACDTACAQIVASECAVLGQLDVGGQA